MSLFREWSRDHAAVGGAVEVGGELAESGVVGGGEVDRDGVAAVGPFHADAGDAGQPEQLRAMPPLERFGLVFGHRDTSPLSLGVAVSHQTRVTASWLNTV